MEIQRESIFVSALRGFCRSLFIVLGIFVAAIILSFVFFAFSSPYQAEEKTSLEILPDLEWKRELVSLSAPAILQINIHGIIGDPEHVDTDSIKAILIDSRSGLLSHDRVKGILLHFDTPGGTVIDSDNIYRLLLKYKEKFKVPVYGYVDGLCASGGMLISGAVDRMYCGTSSVIGSIGVVIGPFFNFYDAMTTYGIKSRTITEGLDKDMMSPFRQWKPDEDESLKKIVASSYERFLDIVTAARTRIDRAKLVAEYGANVFDGVTAQEIGYIDVANSDYETAVTDLLQAANIDPAKSYQIVELKAQRSILSSLVRGSSPLLSGTLEHKLQIGSESSYVIKDKVAYLYQP